VIPKLSLNILDSRLIRGAGIEKNVFVVLGKGEPTGHPASTTGKAGIDARQGRQHQTHEPPYSRAKADVKSLIMQR
jgi:hypothetical protein